MKTRCTMCLEYPRSGNLREFDGQHLCHACYEENVTLCDRCGERIWVDKACFYEGRCLCNSCYAHYTQDAAISVLVVEPGKVPYQKNISRSLVSLQQEVGGDIEIIYPFSDPVAIVCDEGGKMNGKDLNRGLKLASGEIYDVIAGTFLITGLEDENLASLSPELLEKYQAQFYAPEVFLNLGGKIFAISLEF